MSKKKLRFNLFEKKLAHRCQSPYFRRHKKKRVTRIKIKTSNPKSSISHDSACSDLHKNIPVVWPFDILWMHLEQPCARCARTHDANAHI
jgi:hypothetical protein